MDADAKAKYPIANLLQAASLDLDAAHRLLTKPPNMLAAYLNTEDHDLVLLIDGRHGGEPRPLPDGDPWLHVAAAEPMR